MKTIPKKEVDVLGGSFLKAYTEHLTAYPSTLLVHMSGLVKFRRSRGMFSSNEVIYLLFMDNLKSMIDFNKDAYLEFDMKGSKWKHRIMKKGGLRCSPFFPLAFWEKEKAGSSEGEDLDFWALRTQVTPQWYQEQEEVAASAKSDAWGQKVKERLQKLPLHDKCLASHAWVSTKLKATDNFCEMLAQQFAAAEKAIPTMVTTPFDTLDACEYWLHSSLGTSIKNQNVEDKILALSNVWSNTLLEEKKSLEAMRSFFGYPSKPGRDLDQKPLAVEPQLRARLIEQLNRDVALLSSHNLMDYSMSLVIKHEAEALDCSNAGVPTSAKGSIFEQYEGGMRAVGVDGEVAEKAVYNMRIVDILSHGGFAKDVSQWMQSLVAENKWESRVPEVMKDLLAAVGTDKCKRAQANSTEIVMCWSSCGKACPRRTGEHAADLATFDAASEVEWEGLACDGITQGITGGDTRRTLCALSTEKVAMQELSIEVPGSMPYHYKQLGEAELDSALKDPDVEKVLRKDMGMSVDPSAPVALRKIALMSFESFARRPFAEDTVGVGTYAKRFKRYFDQWLTAPTAEEWVAQCPS